VDWQPAAINSLAFSPDGAYLACARHGGEIQLWNIGNGWHLERVVPGRANTAWSKLVWLPGKQTAGGGARLFAAGLHGEIMEVDFLRLRAKHTVDSYGGAVWDLAIDELENKLYAACDDGSVRQFDCSGVSLAYEKVFPRTPKRLLAVCVQGDVLYAAGEEGIIRSWMKRSGQALPNTIRVETMGNGKAAGYDDVDQGSGAIATTIVWSLVALKDHTLVSGDSLGHVQIWDGHTGSLISSFSQHTSDVVALAVNERENILFASGNDHKVVMIRLISGEWKYSYSHRAHTHDVRALAIGKCKATLTKHTRQGESFEIGELLVSGGQDTQICWYDVHQFEKIRPSKVLPYPHQSFMSMCKKERLLLARFDTSLKLWRLGGAPEDPGSVVPARMAFTPKIPCREDQLLEIDVSDVAAGRHTTCAAISSDGNWVVCGFQTCVRMYALSVQRSRCNVRRVQFPTFGGDDGGHGAVSLAFVPDNKRLAFATSSGRIFVAASSNGQDGWGGASELLPCPADLDRLETADGSGALWTSASAHQPIATLAVSPDSQWLACGDVGNRVHVYSLDSMRHHGTLPTPPAQLTALTFLGGNQLLVTTVVGDFCLYDVEKCERSWWHDANPPANLPKGFLQRKKKILGIAKLADVYPETAVMYTRNYFIKVSFDKSVPQPDADLVAHDNRPLKRLRQGGGGKHRKMPDGGEKEKKPGVWNFRITDRYRPVLFVDFVAKEEMVVVERPWVKVLQHFIDPLYIKKYGRA
jgi:U3 small nucleolar RNA-associated protein 4